MIVQTGHWLIWAAILFLAAWAIWLVIDLVWDALWRGNHVESSCLWSWWRHR